MQLKSEKWILDSTYLLPIKSVLTSTFYSIFSFICPFYSSIFINFVTELVIGYISEKL